MNALTKENVKSQLFYLSKESFKHVVLSSKCGIMIPMKELKLRDVPTNDINTFQSFSPLLCIYKKAGCKLTPSDGKLAWNEEKFKKEVEITGNAYMTLTLLEFAEYYRVFKDVDKRKYLFSPLYLNLAKKQLEFYNSNLRSEDGVFVDKKDLSNPVTGELAFEEKNKEFRYGDQALMMAAYYRYSTLSSGKTAAEYKNFSLDFFNMFSQFKEELYDLNLEELLQVSLGFQLFYKYSRLEEAEPLLLDLADLMVESYEHNIPVLSEETLKEDCLFYLNCRMLHELTGFTRFKDRCDKLYYKFSELYDPESGIFVLDNDKKKISYSGDEILTYLLSMILHAEEDTGERDSQFIILDVYRHQFIHSGILPSWPEAPGLEDVERYKNFTRRPDDLLDDQHFRMDTIPTPENSELAPVFIKDVVYDRKKGEFEQGKLSFDSTKNMYLFFLAAHFLRPDTENRS